MVDGRKSYMAFRTISEASEILQVPSHVLRFWEKKFESLSPLKRGGGRRYYRARDISLLLGIKHFLYDKRYSIKRTQEILRKKEKKVLFEIGQQKYLAKSKNNNDSILNELKNLQKELSHKKLSILERVKSDILPMNDQISMQVRNIIDSLRKVQERAISRYN